MEKKFYKRVYYRIESGYMCGGMMDRCKEALEELQQQLQDAGWHLDIPYKPGTACPELSLGKSNLYCHPTQVSGIVETSLIKPLEDIFRKGNNYIFRATDIYEDVYDFTWDELKQYHLDRNRQTIELLLLDSFKTKRSNLYKPVAKVIEHIAEKISVHTFLKANSYIPADVEREVVRELFDGLYNEGHFTVTKGRGDLTIARTNPKPVPVLQVTLF